MTSRERRRAAGLALFPDRDTERAAAVEQVSDILTRAYATSTAQKDKSYFARWTAVCRALGTSEWRTDVRANLGIDPEGHREEVMLQVYATVRLYADMRPRFRHHTAAHPASAGKVMQAVRRVHKTKLLTMADAQYVTLAVRGLLRKFIEENPDPVSQLMPHRMQPLTNEILAGMRDAPSGSTHGGLTLRWGSYFWISAWACFSTMAETGMRCDEVAKPSAATPQRSGHLTFASLVWKIKGAMVEAPTQDMLLRLQPGDGVWVRHGLAKNDPFALWFAATPSFLAFETAGRNACRELAALEMVAAVEPGRRGDVPLFGSSKGIEFTRHQLETAFELLLIFGAKLGEERRRTLSLHSFRIFLACALLSKNCPRWMIKRLLRWRGDASIEVYARVDDPDWRRWLQETRAAVVDSTTAAGLPRLDFSSEQVRDFRQIALGLLSMAPPAAHAEEGDGAEAGLGSA